MKTVIAFSSVFVVILSSPVPASILEAQEMTDTIPVAEPLIYVRVFSDSSGESHLADGQIDFKIADYAPPALPMSVSDPTPAGGVVFLSSPSGWVGDFHPAPHRQFIFLLSGGLEVEVSDGETRRFGPGAVLLVEDTVGRGHVSRVVGGGRAYVVAVPITDSSPR
jgi:quercetin dioxygenase-like cupin family protein